jgi:hypothetical protein
MCCITVSVISFEQKIAPKDGAVEEKIIETGDTVNFTVTDGNVTEFQNTQNGSYLCLPR